LVIIVGEGSRTNTAEHLLSSRAGCEVVGVDVGDGVEGPGEAIDGGGVGALPRRISVNSGLVPGQQHISTKVRHAVRDAAADVQTAAGRDEGEVDANNIRVIATVACDYGNAAVEIGYRGREPD